MLLVKITHRLVIYSLSENTETIQSGMMQKDATELHRI